MKTPILFSILAFLSLASFAQNLHLFMVVDFEDQAIGGRHDHDKIKRLGEDIANATGMSLKLYDYKREATNRTELANAISQISCGSDDVIWFYYFGHGTNCDGTWPLFQVSGGTVCEKDVYDKLITKGARLSVTMFDCCNTGNGIRQNSNLGAARLTASPTTYSTLFKQASGNVIVCGTKQGTYGWSSAIVGSEFTNNFISALNNATGASVSWNQILQQTKAGVEKAADNLCNSNPGRCEATWMQSPYFQVNINTRPSDKGSNAPDNTTPTKKMKW